MLGTWILWEIDFGNSRPWLAPSIDQGSVDRFDAESVHYETATGPRRVEAGRGMILEKI